MKQFKVSDRLNKNWSYVNLNASHYQHLVQENTTVVDEKGKIVFIFLKDILSIDNVAKTWTAIKNYWPATSSRAMAQGYKQEFLRVDGKKTMLKKGRSYCYSGVVGYMDPFPTFPACRPAALNNSDKTVMPLMTPLAEEIAKIHLQYDPLGYQFYEEMQSKTHPHFRVGHSPYTTMTVNKNFQTFPHKDGKNLPATCPMTVIRKGHYSGGVLVFPDLITDCGKTGIGVKVETKDLILFMNSQEWHGNTQLANFDKENVRTSIIYYYRKNMWKCGSIDEELQKVRNLGMGELG